jgi:ribose 5-phosphate isomerase B
MRIGIATDHGGFGLKEELVTNLRAAGHEVVDFGAHICMGGRTVGPAVALDLVETFLAAKFSQAERHLRRLGKVAALEAGKE